MRSLTKLMKILMVDIFFIPGAQQPIDITTAAEEYYKNDYPEEENDLDEGSGMYISLAANIVL